MTQRIDNNKVLTTSALLLFIFSMVCFFTCFFINADQERSTYHNLPAEGGEIELEVKNNNTVYEIDVSQQLFPNSWSYMYITVEDEAREELYAFGSEFWSEKGYDGGAWQESEETFENKITFDKKGKYILVFEPEVTPEHISKVGAISVITTPLKGSYIPHLIAGLFALVLSIILNEIAKRTIYNHFFLSDD